MSKELTSADGTRSRFIPDYSAAGKPGQFYFYQHDPEGNFLQREGSTTQYHTTGRYILDTAIYDGFGNLTADINALTGGASGRANGESIGFGGEWGNYYDPSTKLLCLGYRYYDTGTGRFLSRDPIGYNGGLNLYAYCDNNPINGMDPDGTDPTIRNKLEIGPDGIVYAPNKPENRQRKVNAIENKSNPG